MTDFGKEISSVMSSLSKQDFKGALPYLMLTSKCEYIFRDLLAIRLHKKFQKPNAKQRYEVAREKTFKKKTVDIAILKLRSKTFKDPVAILELKYVATPTTVVKFCKALKNDLKKAKANVKPSDADPGYFGLLLVREARKLQSDNTDDFTEIIGKYKPLSRLQERKLPGKYDKVRDEATTIGLKIFPESPSPISLGKDLGCQIKLRWWLFSL